jgi:L-fucose mutarotase
LLLRIDPLLSGELLWHLDAMGHSDAVLIADAHFPAARIGSRLVTLPGTSTPMVLAAIRTVVPPDDAPALDLMESADCVRVPIHDELIAAAGLTEDSVRFVDRFSYYGAAASAYVIVRTGEERIYGNALLRKGIVRLRLDDTWLA